MISSADPNDDFPEFDSLIRDFCIAVLIIFLSGVALGIIII